MLKGEERGAPFSLVLCYKNAFGRVLKVFTTITVNAGYQPKHLHASCYSLLLRYHLDRVSDRPKFMQVINRVRSQIH